MESFGFFIIGFGVGMIIIHTIYDKRLVFIEKMTKYKAHARSFK
jgi:hypothetical protein